MLCNDPGFDHCLQRMQDLPDGNYHLLKRTGKMQKGKPLRQFWNGITNYRMWGLAACYAYSFGVEVGSVPVVVQALAKSAKWSLQGHMSNVV